LQPNQYDNVESLRQQQQQSHYKDWNDAQNPAPKHYDKIVANQQAIDAGYIDINDIPSHRNNQ
jgi:hypothetical protein